MVKITHVFFDVGGTLLNSDQQLFERMCALIGNRKNKAELVVNFRTKQKSTPFRTITQILSEILKENGIDSENAMLHAHELYIASFLTNGTIYADVIPTLEALKDKKIKLSIISDSDWEIMKLELEKFGLINFFSFFSTSSELKVYKPASLMFEHALKQADVSPENVLHIGDISADILGSKSADIKCVLINRNKRDTSVLQAKPNFEIFSLTELIPLLESF